MTVMKTTGQLSNTDNTLKTGQGSNLQRFVLNSSSALPEPFQVAASILLITCIAGGAFISRKKSGGHPFAA